MAIAEAFVKSKLSPYEGRIRSVIDLAWSDYLSIPVRHKFLYARTRANSVFDLIAGNILSEFDGDKNVRVLQKDESIKLLVDDVLLVRVKKANESGLGSNVPTQSVMAFVSQEPEIPGLLPDIYKVEICYFEDLTGAEIASVKVTARDNNKLLWSYEIERSVGSSAEIVPFPNGTVDDTPPEISPRKIEQDQTDSKKD
jgi:hypothetical protein